MHERETKFLRTQEFQPLNWFSYIGNVFFIVPFMTEFNNYNPNIKFNYESNE